ncbi:MAG: hypothetical protein LCI03_20560 [Actinobacteria bacterium]|nr:hypothetical protein [Actinomycetota bacterium]
MSETIRAFDMSKYQRIIATEGRIRGSFHVRGSDPGTIWITAHDVVIYDEARFSGRVYGSKDLRGSVENGVATISKRSIPDSLLPDVEEVWDLMLRTLVLVAQAFTEGIGSLVVEEAGS